MFGSTSRSPRYDQMVKEVIEALITPSMDDDYAAFYDLVEAWLGMNDAQRKTYKRMLLQRLTPLVGANKAKAYVEQIESAVVNAQRRDRSDRAKKAIRKLFS